MGVLRASAAALALHTAGVAGAAVARQGVAPAHPSASGSAVLAHVSSDKGQGEIKPTLDPQSDHVFFKKDYPDDKSPPTNWIGGSRPTKGVYPNFQPDDIYDRDYVKDENGDNGEWAAQSKYDKLRTMVKKAKADADGARKREDDEAKDMEAERARAAAAEAAAAKARADAEAARKKHDIAEERLKGLDGYGSGHGPGAVLGGSIADWQAKVKELQQAVADCKKRVAEKTALLEKLKKEAFSQATEVAAEQKKAHEDVEAAEAELEKVKAAKPSGVDTQLHALTDKDGQLAVKLQEKEKAHAKALAQYQKSHDEVVKVEAQIKDAIARLRAAREAKLHPKPKAAAQKVVVTTPAPLSTGERVLDAAESLWHRISGR